MENLKEANEWFELNLTETQAKSLFSLRNAHDKTINALKRKGLVEPAPDGHRLTSYGMDVAGFLNTE